MTHLDERTTITPDARSGGALRVRDVTRTYGTTTALAGIDLDIPAGSLTAIIGPSGCGKSTLLRLLSGLEEPTGGTVDVERGVDGQDVAMVFQDYALYPHMTVEQNLSFGLRLQARHHRRSGPSRAEITARVTETAGLLGLTTMLGRRPAQLSGGQRQRVALGRAIIRRPAVMLLDEPMAALDVHLRAEARTELLRLHRDIGCTMVLVTHDQQEALSMSDHLVLLRDGAVEQTGPPLLVYERPETLFAATFLGSPPMNIADDGHGRHLGWRPHHARLVAPGTATATDGFEVTATAELCEFTGDGQLVSCRGRTGAAFSIRQHAGTPWLRPGDPVHVVVDGEHLHHFDGSGRRVPPPVEDVRSGG